MNKNSRLRRTYGDWERFLPFPEFGLPIWRNQYWHFIDDKFIVSHSGHRVASIDKNNVTTLYLPAFAFFACNAVWTSLFTGNVNFRHKRVVNTAGIESVTLRRWFDDIHKAEIITGAREVQIYPDGKMIISKAAPSIIKNNTKYRVFNVRLKQLRALITTQIKMGAYNNYQPAISNLHPTHLPEVHLLKQWMKTEDPAIARYIGYRCKYTTKSDSDHIGRLNYYLKVAQRDFLRRECITIVES